MRSECRRRIKRVVCVNIFGVYTQELTDITKFCIKYFRTFDWFITLTVAVTVVVVYNLPFCLQNHGCNTKSDLAFGNCSNFKQYCLLLPRQKFCMWSRNWWIGMNGSGAVYVPANACFASTAALLFVAMRACVPNHTTTHTNSPLIILIRWVWAREENERWSFWIAQSCVNLLNVRFTAIHFHSA